MEEDNVSNLDVFTNESPTPEMPEKPKKHLAKWAKVLIIIIIVALVAFALVVLFAVLFFIFIGRSLVDSFGSGVSEFIGDVFRSIIKEGVSQAANGVGEDVSEFVSGIIS